MTSSLVNSLVVAQMSWQRKGLGLASLQVKIRQYDFENLYAILWQRRRTDSIPFGDPARLRMDHCYETVETTGGTFDDSTLILCHLLKESPVRMILSNSGLIRAITSKMASQFGHPRCPNSFALCTKLQPKHARRCSALFDMVMVEREKRIRVVLRLLQQSHAKLEPSTLIWFTPPSTLLSCPPSISLCCRVPASFSDQFESCLSHAHYSRWLPTPTGESEFSPHTSYIANDLLLAIASSARL